MMILISSQQRVSMKYAVCDFETLFKSETTFEVVRRATGWPMGLFVKCFPTYLTSTVQAQMPGEYSTM